MDTAKLELLKELGEQLLALGKNLQQNDILLINLLKTLGEVVKNQEDAKKAAGSISENYGSLLRII